MRLKPNRAQSEERLHDYLHELKRASDALFKALAAQEMRLKSFEDDNKKQPEEEASLIEDLTADEEHEIALQIHLDNQQS